MFYSTKEVPEQSMTFKRPYDYSKDIDKPLKLNQYSQYLNTVVIGKFGHIGGFPIQMTSMMWQRQRDPTKVRCASNRTMDL